MFRTMQYSVHGVVARVTTCKSRFISPRDENATMHKVHRVNISSTSSYPSSDRLALCINGVEGRTRTAERGSGVPREARGLIRRAGRNLDRKSIPEGRKGGGESFSTFAILKRKASVDSDVGGPQVFFLLSCVPWMNSVMFVNTFL